MKKQTTKKKVKVSAPKELEVLRRIVEITNSALDLEHVLKDVVSVVNEMTKADSVLIYLYDEKKKNLILKASKTPHKKELENVFLKSGEGIAGWAAKENKPVAIENKAYQDKRFKNFDVLPEDKYEAMLSVPIVTKKAKPIGVVNVQHKKAHVYASATIDLISLIAKQISGAIENARLYEETKNKAAQFDALNKVSQSITSHDYLDEILNLIVVVTAEMLNSKICSIMLVAEKEDELIMAATQSLSLEYKKKPNIKIQSSICGKVIQTKEPVVVYDVCKEEGYCYQDLAKQEKLSSMLSVPMIVKNKAIGIISVYTKRHHEFVKEEIDVLQMVANQAAVAVENTKLVKAAIKAKEDLEVRKVVEKAKGIIMTMNNISEDMAYKMIHKKAMNSGKTMKEIAESILLLDEFKV